jgi:hypothetical protein
MVTHRLFDGPQCVEKLQKTLESMVAHRLFRQLSVLGMKCFLYIYGPTARIGLLSLLLFWCTSAIESYRFVPFHIARALPYSDPLVTSTSSLTFNIGFTAHHPIYSGSIS